MASMNVHEIHEICTLGNSKTFPLVWSLSLELFSVAFVKMSDRNSLAWKTYNYPYYSPYLQIRSTFFFFVITLETHYAFGHYGPTDCLNRSYGRKKKKIKKEGILFGQTFWKIIKISNQVPYFLLPRNPTQVLMDGKKDRILYIIHRGRFIVSYEKSWIYFEVK